MTGGGHGLGRVFAQALAAAGADIVLFGRSAEGLNQTVDSIGRGVRAFPVDVCDAKRIGVLFRHIGPVDLLVNNAGVLGPIGPFSENKFDDWWRAMDVNVRGAMLCTHAVLPGMLARRRGRIVNIVTGAFSAPYLSAYLTSKTALIRATECLAAEIQTRGLEIFSVAPGTVQTSMSMFSLNSPEGQRWIPWFQRIFEEHLDLPPERPAALVVALASGKYDALSGLHLTPFDDLDAMLTEIAQIEKSKLHTLQLRPRNVSEAAASIASIRAAAQAQRVD